jgi:hypothetical protein
VNTILDVAKRILLVGLWILKWEVFLDYLDGTILLVLKMEEEVTSQGIEAISRSWKNQRSRFSRACQRNTTLLIS